ncbi:MAG: translation initiation factor IF-2 [Clostridiales bacterium]|nr:translation initiation factor IF-2 [Clostridiales bacterium]
MAKIKIYELAKELSVESKEILRKLQKMNVQAKNHMSAINAKDADAIRQEYAAKNAGPGQIVGPGGFMPRIKRIPKAQVEMENAAAVSAKTTQTENVLDKSEQTDKSSVENEGQTPILPTVADKEAGHLIAKTTSQPEISSQPVATAPPLAPELPVAADPIVKKEPAARINQEQSRTLGQNTAAGRPLRESKSESKPKGQGAYSDKARREGSGPAPKREGQTGGGQGFKRDGQAGWPAAKRDGQAAGQQGRPYAQGSKSQGTGQAARRDGQAGYSDRARFDSSGQGRREGQGGYSDRGRAGTGSARPPGQAGYSDKPRRDGAVPNRPPVGRPQGGRPQGGRPQTGRPDSGFNMPPSTASQEKPSNYRPPAAKKNYTKDQILDRADDGGRSRDFRFGKGRRDKPGRRKETKMVMPPVVPKKIMIGETVVLSELAHAMGKTAAEIIKKLFQMGFMATINQDLDSETAILLADEYGITVEVTIDKAAEIMEDVEDDASLLKERPPVVTIMGHVDHGKTSLLDAIRSTNVISTEAGGITQHIGAYQVEIKGKKITFLDTPGHEAFTAMRARGAQVTDIAIIVVAADDGVMPQTIEAINHSKAAGVPIIIAINKIDKPSANQDRVKQELTEHGLVSEDWGGDTIMVPVSAKGRQNIEGLLEMILLVAEVAELRANPSRHARGTVVESRLDKARGSVVTLLVQKGTLHVGDSLLAGHVFGKVRAMTDDKGRRVRQALPSMPVEVMGFSEVPSAGEVFIAAKDDKDARFVAQRHQIKKREEELRKTTRVSLDDLFQRIAEGAIKDLNLVVKADVHGSAEAIQQSLEKLNSETPEVRVNVIHSGVGGISESDVMLAAASDAIIIGFNVRPMPAALKAAEHEQVDIRLYRVIYDALDDIKKAMSGLLAPEFKEQVIGHAEVRAVFKVPKAGFVAGCYVLDGKVIRNAQARVLRDSVVIADDKIDSLRRFKDDAKEVLSGFECGIGLESFNDIKENDIIEIFIMEEIKRAL